MAKASAAKKTRPSAKAMKAIVDDALRRYFAQPEYAIFFEVANATGGNARRRADAIAMACWPSRGLRITQIEIKVSRADWLREKADPAKAEEIAAYCDTFALVTAEDVAMGKEIPHAWDWYVVAENGSMTKKQSGYQQEVKPLDRPFVASLLRSAGKVDDAAIQARVDRMTAALEKEFDERVERAVRERAADSTAADDLMARIKSELGINGYAARNLFNDDDFMVALKAVYDMKLSRSWGGIAQIGSYLQSAARDAQAIADGLKTACDRLKPVEKEDAA